MVSIDSFPPHASLRLCVCEVKHASNNFQFRSRVRTVDPGEALDDDGAPSKVSGLQGGVLSAGPLAVVLISHHHPLNAVGLQDKETLGHILGAQSSPLTRQHN